MLGRGQLETMWSALIGPSYARQLAGTYAPLRALLLLFPAWWAIGIFHALANGSVRTTLGTLNAAFPLVLLAVVLVCLVLQRKVRNGIRRSLAERGFDSLRRPMILTPSRFQSWLSETGIPPELASEILSEVRPRSQPKAAGEA
jgi:hypothetical protein